MQKLINTSGIEIVNCFYSCQRVSILVVEIRWTTIVREECCIKNYDESKYVINILILIFFYYYCIHILFPTYYYLIKVISFFYSLHKNHNLMWVFYIVTTIWIKWYRNKNNMLLLLYQIWKILQDKSNKKLNKIKN